MGAVYRLTLRQLAGRWRLAVLTVLAALPVLISALLLGFDDAPSSREYEGGVLGAMFAGAIVPLAVLALAAVAFANEVEDRTLANLVLSPLPRWRIALPKLLASVTIAAPFVAVSAFLTGWIAFVGDPVAALAVTAALLVAVLLYAALFTWLGLVTPQAIGVGLLYVLIWEGLFSGFVAGARLLSLRWYALAVLQGLDPRRFRGIELLSLPVALGLCALVIVGFSWLTVRRLRRMDVP